MPVGRNVEPEWCGGRILAGGNFRSAEGLCLGRGMAVCVLGRRHSEPVLKPRARALTH